MQKKPIILILSLVLGLTLVAGLLLTGGKTTAQASAMTELNVSNLSCGSCVSNIQNALAQVDGVGQVDVSVTSGRSQITYDPALIQPAQIAKVITDAGYPAKVRLELSAAEYAKLQTEAEQLSSDYVARIGKRLVSKEEFGQLLALRSSGGLAGNPSGFVNPQLQAQVWQELKEREVLLAAADRNQIVVQDGEVEIEVAKIKGATQNFAAAVEAQFGNYERFFARIKENLIINRNIEQNVVAGLTDERQKQLRFSQWYQETLQNTDVVIFDPALKLAASAGSSCGGSCGGS